MPITDTSVFRTRSDALESSFTLNFIILVGATYYVKLSEGDQRAVGYTSVSIALATFIGILAYHIFQQLKHTKLWKKVPKLNLKFKKLNTKQTVNNLNNPTNIPTEFVNLGLKTSYHLPTVASELNSIPVIAFLQIITSSYNLRVHYILN